jgi:hypothetical protein
LQTDKQQPRLPTLLYYLHQEHRYVPNACTMDRTTEKSIQKHNRSFHPALHPTVIAHATSPVVAVVVVVHTT